MAIATGGELQIEISAAAVFDTLAATGTLTIAPGAKLQVAFAPGSTYVPIAGDQFVLVTAVGGVSGGFDQLDLPSVEGLAWSLVVAEQSFMLKLTAAISADFNLDGIVDGADFLVWQRGAGIVSGGEPSNGDANGDGIVDGADLEAWRQQYGGSSTAAHSAVFAEVPEPNGALLAGLAIAVAAPLRASPRLNRYNVRL